MFVALQSYLMVDERIQAGMPQAEARRAASLEMGGVEAVKAQVRDVRAGAFAEQFFQDARYGARLLRRNRFFR
jgi:hypothetical protein